MSSQEKTAKISFPCDDGDVERMTGIYVKDGLYKLDNSPFYFYGISFGDLFKVKENGGDLIFERVIARGGHSTYRVKIPIGEGHNFFLKNWTSLQDLGCTYEGSDVGPQRLYAIDVPPSADIFKVYELLEKGEREELWVFEEGHYCDTATAE
ncbi:DUF4265 domain-containing protein [Xanthomonas maliensis]|uniref:DUF4265 domain-containing protein n=1 Tax=Xanthomonas maliensis TaxID=1321368 RepID=UPI001264A4DA|nr:DUF4265 domain-containing protein [Xanthomonas maliensis]KAB7768816.1 hypothetical protein CKY51_08610 [Xanthomonas maliensis]